MMSLQYDEASKIQGTKWILIYIPITDLKGSTIYLHAHVRSSFSRFT